MRSLSITILLTAGFLLLQTGTAPGQGAEWRLREELRIGAVDGPLALSRISRILVSADGHRVYALQPQANEISIFDAASGAPQGTIGGRGAGPGEFQALSRMGWKGDTLWASDRDRFSISYFTGSGAFLRSERVEPPKFSGLTGGGFVTGMLSTGEIVAEPHLMPAAIASGEMVEAPWVVVRRDGTVLRRLATLDLRGAATQVPVGTVAGLIAQPMSTGTYLSMSPDGDVIAVVKQPADADPVGQFQVQRLRTDGTQLYLRTFRYTPLPVSKAFADSLFAQQALIFENVVPRGAARSAARQYLRVPPVHPPASALEVSSDGNVWIRRENTGRALVRWAVLDGDGHMRATVLAPADAHLLHVDDEVVWGTAEDDLDIPYLLRFRVVR